MASETSGLQYTESGQGEPVILLDWTPWQSTALADALATRYRVFSVDPPDAARTSEDVATAVAGTAGAAGLASYALVGASIGANVAFQVALLSPESVSTLALVSPDCVEPLTQRPWNTPELAVATMLAHPEFPGLPQPEPARTATLAALADTWRTAIACAAPRLPELTCATLVVLGQEDRLVSREAGGVWKERVPNCSVCYVYDAGHAIAIDRPDALAKVVLDFVERRETFVVENRSSVINP